MEQRRITVPADRPPERLDRFLVERLPDLSRSQIRRLIDEGQILRDDAPVRAGHKTRGGETLTVNIPPPVAVETLPEAIPLKVLFEDRHLIVIDKPAGLVVHPAPGHGGGTLVNALLHHCQDLSGIGGELRPGIVHRLDKDTSGVMLATKTDEAHRHLASQFKRHSIRRSYLALVHGLVQNDAGTIDRPIGRHPVHRQRMSGQAREGKRAVTHWQVRSRFDRDRLTLLELRLETGRTHQIRVHFSEMNLPLAGDPVYGGRNRINAVGDLRLRRLLQELNRQALHARLLGFVHPESGEELEFTSPLPDDLREVLAYLEEKYRTAG